MSLFKKVTPPNQVPKLHWLRQILLGSLLLTLVASITWVSLTQLYLPPASFPTNQSFVIERGASLPSISTNLKRAGYIKSETMFYLLMVLSYDPSTIKAGSYRFTNPATMHQLAERITRGGERDDLVRITFIEGERVTQFAARAANVLSDFDSDSFVTLASPFEGKLFPDTYFIPPDFTPTQLLTLLTTKHEEVMVPLQPDIEAQSLSDSEIIVLASIIEREANSPESKKMVAGILLTRLEIGMPLQADASIEYVLDKPLSALTPADLTIDSPYNTYRTLGLPPTPIGNPGLQAIEAVLHPTPSEYLFYITGRDGIFYYARTYDEHLRNIERYLR